MPQMAPLAMTSWFPITLSCFSMGVSGLIVVSSSNWSLPISVYPPVATTTASPSPPVTSVPRKTIFFRSAIGMLSSDRGSVFLKQAGFRPSGPIHQY